jgi:hypothetical protein
MAHQQMNWPMPCQRYFMLLYNSMFVNLMPQKFLSGLRGWGEGAWASVTFCYFMLAGTLYPGKQILLSRHFPPQIRDDFRQILDVQYLKCQL